MKVEGNWTSPLFFGEPQLSEDIKVEEVSRQKLFQSAAAKEEKLFKS